MNRQAAGRWAFSLSGAGGNDDCRFGILIQRYEEGKATQHSLSFDGKVPLDGEEYGPAEWIREVLMGIIESF